jgi:gamma-glutamylaminecyclotransferase
MTLIFVYGTLKRNGSNHRFLAGQAFVGEGRTNPGFVLYEIDDFPGMVRREDGHQGVKGEVWSVDDQCLAQLDQLECAAEGLYRREAVPMADSFAGQRIEAYIYLPSIEGRPKVGAEWPP